MRCVIWPSGGLKPPSRRDEFLTEARLWNRVEGLPTIELDPRGNGFEVLFRASEDRGVRRLIDGYGGYVKPRFLREGC